MYLLIDISELNKIHLAIFDKKSVRQAQDKIEHKYYSGRNRKLLVCIDKMFKGIRSKEGSPLGKGGTGGLLSGIMVVVGTGSFTSTRIACVVANTFAFALHIPLLAIKQAEIDKVQELIPKLLKQKPGHYLSATYSGEPNLGNPKSN